MDQSDFDPARRPRQSTLPGGLRVRLVALPRSAQAAALVRVHAGAHDAPAAYPGLAHFLEHLLFLGSHDYPVEAGLMPFVQRCGGQLNACTRERHTDFFFQVPSDQLDEALSRLLDMLARPLLDPAAQLREREVLHAEYLARAQDVETLCDAALGTGLNAAHPFSAFHAGNRDTLPVEDADFQQALLGYHRSFYHAGQIELLLAGPQSPAQLQRLAQRADAALVSAATLPRTPPRLPGADDAWLRLHLEQAAPRLDIGFILNDLPPDSAAALDHLATWLDCEAPDSLMQRLRDEGWCESLKLRAPYWYAGQGVLVVELRLTEQGLACQAQIVAALRDWLRFFIEDAPWPACRDEYRHIRRASLRGMPPLARLRYWVEPGAWGQDSDEAEIRRVVQALIGQMIEGRPIVLGLSHKPCPVVERGGFPLRICREPAAALQAHAWHWRQPPPNPWLHARPAPRQAALSEPALRWMYADDEGALYLRWRFAERPSRGLWQALWSALQSRQWAARQAGIELRFEDFGHGWCLSLLGPGEALPGVLTGLAELLGQPPASAFTEVRRRPDEMLIRQLLGRLPQVLAGARTEPASAVDQAALSRLWQGARWDGLVAGVPDSLSGPVVDALQRLPGRPADGLDQQVIATGEYHWQDAGEPSAETALLLFCALPAREPATEAAWRLLARLMEGDFFRRLRSELQLGYAVFCGFRQVGEQAGVVFGVQSPSASATVILGHIETFLTTFARQLEGLSLAQLRRDAAASADSQVGGERAWQACLAGDDPDHPQRVAKAMGQLRPIELSAQLQALRTASGGWWVLANAPPPAADPRWQTREQA